MQKRHPNAQDGVEKGNFALGTKTTFREAYPQVVDLNVEVLAFPMGFGMTETYNYSIHYTPGQYTPCPNPRCKGGGFDVGSFLYHLIRAGKTQGETDGGCVGREQVGRNSRRCCLHSFKCKATIVYSQA